MGGPPTRLLLLVVEAQPTVGWGAPLASVI